MRRTAFATALLAVVATAGCAYPSAAERARLNGLIGHSEVDLLRSYGVPTRSYAAQGHTFLAYDRSYTTYDPGFGGFGPWGGFGPYGGFGYGGFGYGGFGGGFGYGGFGGGIPPTIESYSCVTTFEVDGGRVAAWTLHGDGC